MVREPNACMCGQDCEPTLCHLQTVRIPFAMNWNLSVFCANTKRIGCARCPFHAPSILCSSRVRRKLINHAPHTNGAACKRCACVYKAYAFVWKNFSSCLQTGMFDIHPRNFFLCDHLVDQITTRVPQNSPVL